MKIPPDVPVYVFIKRQLKSQIESGELPEGGRVLSESELARKYGVSRNPTRQALRDLEFEGYITRTPGRGSFVAPVSKRQKPLRVPGWHTLAIACPELECHYTREVLQGFMAYAAEKNFHPMVYFRRFTPEAEYEFLTDIRNSGIEGVALWLQHATDENIELLARFHRSAFPFVLIDRYSRRLESDFVVSNNEDLGWQLTGALIAKGHRDIGFLGSPMDNTSVEERLTGYRRALSEAGIDFTDELTAVFRDNGTSARTIVSNIMAYRRRPSAFCCSNDGVATTLLDELSALGYRVPKDVELATVDDNRLSEALDTPVLIASQAGYQMGRESAELLIARVQDPNRPLQKRFLRATLCETADETC